jgi:hypothetical protein
MPRNAPDAVTETRLTLGTWERNQVQPILDEVASAAKAAKWAAFGASAGSVMTPLVIGGVGGALALGLVGFGLGDALDKERIRNIILGTPQVERTRADGTTQTIENLFFGVPIIGPLFGTGMRIGTSTAEAVTSAAASVDEALTDVVGAITSDYQDAILRRQATEARADQAGRSTAGGGPIGTRPAPRDPGAADPRNRWTSASGGGWSV